MRKIATVCLIALFIISNTTKAQKSNENVRAKKSKTILLPAVSYAPETSLALGVSSVKLFAADSSKNSQVTTTGLYTFKNQFLIESNSQFYFNQNRMMAKAKFNLNKYPENYYGTGNSTEDSSKTVVNYSVIKLEGSVMKQLATNLYLGPKINVSDYFNVRSAQEAEVKAFGEHGGLTTGLGFGMIYDARDNILDATKGTYTEISSVWNNTCFGGDFSYYSFDADLRKYFPVFKNTVLALQTVAQLKTGDVPFLQLSYLGGSSIMRGYYSGRYRANNLLAVQAELRRQLTQKLGVVFFSGYGEVADRLKHFNLGDLHKTIGFGLRRRLSKTEKINLRFDVGFVNGKGNIYVNIAEAF